jgi:hypothetical protein
LVTPLGALSIIIRSGLASDRSMHFSQPCCR